MQLIQSMVHGHRRSFVVFASLGLLIAACGGDSDQPAEPVAAATAAAVATGAPATASPTATAAPTTVATPSPPATAAPTSTVAPTAAPTSTAAPTAAPPSTATPAPTAASTVAPTAAPTEAATAAPTAAPTQAAVGAATVQQHETDIAGFAFASELRIAVGDGVTWTNRDGAPHTVTADDDSVRSGFLEQGGSVQLVFGQAGTFSYFCSVHPTTMSGLVIVGDGAGIATPALGAVAAGTTSDIDY
ncbi:MAG TPA: plastocyanin/azurin family copper-binding protein [Dehalococcoidia bacterium]|nr:plastocyanin/azurin family copper-binding protein [Dehalococcoidia bacterium]